MISNIQQGINNLQLELKLWDNIQQYMKNLRQELERKKVEFFYICKDGPKDSTVKRDVADQIASILMKFCDSERSLLLLQDFGIHGKTVEKIYLRKKEISQALYNSSMYNYKITATLVQKCIKVIADNYSLDETKNIVPEEIQKQSMAEKLAIATEIKEFLDREKFREKVRNRPSERGII